MVGKWEENMMTNKARNVLAIAGLGLLLMASGIPVQASSTVVEKEKKLVDLMLWWADLRSEMRGNVKLTGVERKAVESQTELVAAQAQQLVEQLRPEFASPSRATPFAVFQYVLSLIHKIKPEKDQVLRSEFGYFLAEQTRHLLNTLKAGLENYLVNKGSYPESGNVRLAKEIAPPGPGGLVRLPKMFYDKDGKILDHWGRPIVYKRISPAEHMLYSLGPNGEDEGGKGDDVVVSR